MYKDNPVCEDGIYVHPQASEYNSESLTDFPFLSLC